MQQLRPEKTLSPAFRYQLLRISEDLMKIKTKISLLAILSNVSASLIIMGVLYYSLKKSLKERVADYRKELLNERTLMSTVLYH
jgi:hypothetical protein